MRGCFRAIKVHRLLVFFIMKKRWILSQPFTLDVSNSLLPNLSLCCQHYQSFQFQPCNLQMACQSSLRNESVKTSHYKLSLLHLIFIVFLLRNVALDLLVPNPFKVVQYQHLIACLGWLEASLDRISTLIATFNVRVCSDLNLTIRKITLVSHSTMHYDGSIKHNCIKLNCHYPLSLNHPGGIW